MPPARTSRLQINTSIAGPSSSRISDRGLSPSSALSSSTFSSHHPRSASTASSSSLVSDTARLPNAPMDAGRSLANPQQSSLGVTGYSHSPTGSASDEGDGLAQDYVLAMHDFEPENQNGTCLAFRAGQVIHVLNRHASGWWDGELDGRRGWFPSNYVTNEVGLLTEEELPVSQRPRMGHSHTKSTASATSWTSTPSARSKSFSRTNHRPMTSQDIDTGPDPYCPPLMIPLLNGLSLLQNAVRTNRIAHFQPSTACIISCVRALLSDIGCLPRDAPVLKRHGALAQERKRILSDLAALVSQAKRASEHTLTNEELRELEIQAMVRLGGQLFAHVRGFLAIAVQCGVNMPSAGGRQSGSAYGSSDTDVTLVLSDEGGEPFAGGNDRYWDIAEGAGSETMERRRSVRTQSSAGARSSFSRTKSMGDLRSRPTSPGSVMGKTPTRRLVSAQAKHSISSQGHSHKASQYSVSSVSSSSSFSSGGSIGTPDTAVFPTGPSTTAEVIDALRYTHDHYLSTIAAFIGHAHSHSRTSHASSTGHMYDLVREVVDMVCKLLTIVEAVLKNPDIPPQKIENLKLAKEGLYNTTSTLADAVRSLTAVPPPDIAEEEEKSALLRCATNAVKSGSDCVNAVKKCLQRPAGAKQLIIQLPLQGEFDPASYTPRKFSHQPRMSMPRLSKPSSLRALQSLYHSQNVTPDDEDITIQAQTPSFAETMFKESSSDDDTEPSTLPTPVPPVAESPLPEVELEPETPLSPSPPMNKPLPPLKISNEPVEPDLQSPVSVAPTDCGTTWEGSHRDGPPSLYEAKLLNGDLPAVPEASLPEIARPNPVLWTLGHDYASEDVAFNSDGQLVGATLAALVERMTPHDSLVEPPFAAVFFLTFRLFTSPSELVGAIIARYNLLPPAGLSQSDMFIWQQRKGLPVRLRVSNFVKSWLENYWRPATDNVVLPSLLAFTRDALSLMFPIPSQRIMEFIMHWMAAGANATVTKADRSRDAGMPLNPPSAPAAEIPRPIMTKALLSSLRNKTFASINLTDFDTLELARQLTTMECNLYCAIQPEEVLETGQQGGVPPVNVRAVSSLSTAITGWVAESILNEPDTKKRTTLVKFFIKLADRCTTLNNFSTPRSILAALDSSTISRLHQTWTGLHQKHRLQLEELRKLADHARNYHEYRSRLRNTAPPAVPFLGLYLTDVTFCREGNPSHRASPKAPDHKLINFNKYHKLARIVQDMQRFQVPYTLKEIPEVQEYLRVAFENAKHRGDLQDLYRRSLLVEPKRPADAPPPSDVRQLFNWGSRSQSQQVPPTSAS